MSWYNSPSFYKLWLKNAAVALAFLMPVCLVAFGIVWLFYIMGSYAAFIILPLLLIGFAAIWAWEDYDSF